ncbi:hypothetical protein SAMN02745146_0083 [Hymenobacter daecheongensis DSM 21074]|uniref:Phage virion morphogenesis family protein n=1 Tax=Hymenobacter daecheongensis DSM 21074 TaxID=1121955 RepID=A0A1M6LWT1_9BACT|nr:hypothetical protein [Hymenobacter daecheongensis]SHJ75610.1 hypothetical protein SAMN02745146_0083 [Hymenobacter daecheongensis DSM 21074]
MMSIQGSKIPFEEFAARFRDFKQTVLPRLVGREALRTFDENFDNGGFTDKVFIRWKPRKGDTENKGRRLGDGGRQSGRALLIKEGSLRRSLRVAYAGPGSVRLVAGNQDVPYAGIHNDGGTISGTASVGAYVRRRFEEDEVSKPGARKAKFVKVTTGSFQVKAHTRQLNTKMPRRRFMGASAKLMDRVGRLFFRHINQLWQAS